ncbi:hypothetical protein KEM54_003628 [Ascosphaera aggregata]|nr:hypothetical protein KEM54_003628 [Ascosphaera aggregata]
MPPRISLLTSSRLVKRSAQSFFARDRATLDISRCFHALFIKDSKAAGNYISSVRKSSAQQSWQQRRWKSSNEDPEVKKLNDKIKNTPDDKLAGHHFPHPKIVMSKSPEEEQGSPVEEFFKRDKNAIKYAPKIMQEKLNPKPPGSGSGSGSGSRSYSTSAVEPPTDPAAATWNEATPMEQLIAAMGNGSAPLEEPIKGLKFSMPATPDYATGHLRKRYDPVLDQFTKMLMRHGKLAKAENNMNAIINILRCSPPPELDSDHRLIYPLPAEEFPLNPILYLTNVVDSVAPLLRLRQLKGAAGGGMSLPVPQPLNSRQRRRTAIKWIIEASEKRRDISLPKRVAEEIIAVAEGRSTIWQKRDNVHKSGITARTNVSFGRRR